MVSRGKLPEVCREYVELGVDNEGVPVSRENADFVECIHVC